MPKIQVNREEFERLLGEQVSDERLRDEASLLGAHWFHIEGKKWEVEVYPDRPDLLSVEGLARAYRGFFGIQEGIDSYEVSEGDLELKVDESVKEVRPYIGGAVVRELELDERAINGLIQLQEKLHESMGRKRDKLAIGLHDLSTVEPPFTYRAVEPEQVSFKPLEYDREMQLGEILDEHEKGREYAWILEDEDRYPVIVDSKDRVLSFPPVINNQLTEVSTGTQDIFIDVTGKHEETVRQVLRIIVTALAERGGSIESVDVEGVTMPDLSPDFHELGLDYFRDISGLELSPAEITSRMEEMKMGVGKREESMEVEVPAYRNDIMHQYDLIEDVVIAHGYQNVEPELPGISQVGTQESIQDLDDRLRQIMMGSGALEVNTYYLSSREKLFDKMELKQEEIVEMSNALNENFSVMRNWLLPSLLEILRNNRHHSYPQKFFETAETAVLDDSATGSSNVRRLAYVVSGEEVDYTDVREVLQVLERDLGIDFEVTESRHSSFRKERSGEIICDGKSVGVIGEFSDAVVENWELERPVAGFEMDMEKLSDMA